MSLVFGPVPSRRLGRSLGINNIPPKVCTYSCVYCQVGTTIKMQTERKEFYNPEQIFSEVKYKIEKASKLGETTDYLSFVPDGEPTLDKNLGYEISLLKPLRIKIAVITNSSLLWHDDVRDELSKADWVSVKVDTVNDKLLHKINRPHGSLDLNKILNSIRSFSDEYNGYLVSETMLVKGLNDTDESLKPTVEFLSGLNLKKSYISIPTRPPAEQWVRPPESESVNKAYQIFNSSIDEVELLIDYEGSSFTFAGDVENDLLSITSVHPMRKDAVEQFLHKANSDWTIVQMLIDEKELSELDYEGNKFFLRNLSKRSLV